LPGVGIDAAPPADKGRQVMGGDRGQRILAKCLVIAEDLGTAPEGFSDALMQSGILSYRILAFEIGSNGIATYAPSRADRPSGIRNRRAS
jgi:4-alpha-glucanotransferase